MSAESPFYNGSNTPQPLVVKKKHSTLGEIMPIPENVLSSVSSDDFTMAHKIKHKSKILMPSNESNKNGT